jgi:hypothetical protein
VNPTPEFIRAIDGIADPVGVLSLYGDGPAAATRRSPADRALALRRRLQGVEAGLREAAAAAVADRYRRWLPHIESQLFRLAHASSPGAAVFLPLSSGRPLRVDLPMPVGEHARLEPTGHVMPLVAAHDEGRPAGVVIARRSSVQVREWRQGRIDEELDLPIPSRARGSDRHRWGGRGYRIDAVAEGLRRVVEERGWRRLLIAGDPRLRAAVACGRPLRHDVEVRTLAGELEGMSAGDLAVRVAADLDAAQRQYEWRLVERVLDAALDDQSAVLGADAVVAALELGLVEHLVIDPSRVASDAPPRTAAAERMAELALASGAEITPLEGTGARLADVGGVAALLR